MAGESAQLLDFIVDHYNLDELRTLCFKLPVPYEELPGVPLSAKARELILYLLRRERLADLLAALEQDFPAAYSQADFPKDPALLAQALSADSAPAVLHPHPSAGQDSPDDKSRKQGQRDAVREISRTLRSTHTAFKSQIRRRNELRDMIEDRLQIRSNLQYEDFFFRYYPQLNREELFEFKQIRSITDRSLQNGNRRILELLLELLEQYSDLFDEMPELEKLRLHLVFWLDKYEGVFVKTEAMCVLYTGVEDGIPFPRNVDNVISEWLEQA